MKKLILFTLLCLPATVNAQSYPKMIKDTLFLTEGDYFVKGTQIKTGAGTLPNGDFKFVFSSPTSVFAVMSATSDNPTAGIVHLASSFAGYNLNIKEIRKDGSKKVGYKYHLVVTANNSFKYWVDIQNALTSGEIMSAAPKQTASGDLTVTDEIKKLKELLDSGAITQSEYDSQKKKLLKQ